MKINGCYICESNKNKLIYVKNKQKIYECLRCGFKYVYPVPRMEVLEAFYKQFDYKSPDIAESVIRSDARRSLRIIERYSSIGKLLDVGCGRGFFLDESNKRGWSSIGIDYSDKILKYAKRVLGLEVINVDIVDYKSNKKFDVISLNQVIEHLHNPSAVVDKCYSLLKRKGIIYIATPNINSLSARIHGEDFDYLIPPEHLGYYDDNSLTLLLSESGFRVIYIGTWSYSSDLAGILKKIIKLKQNISIGSNNISINSLSGNRSVIKRIKYILFDKIFCKIFYKLLNINKLGTNIEIIAIKD